MIIKIFENHDTSHQFIQLCQKFHIKYVVDQVVLLYHPISQKMHFYHQYHNLFSLRILNYWIYNIHRYSHLWQTCASWLLYLFHALALNGTTINSIPCVALLDLCGFYEYLSYHLSHIGANVDWLCLSPWQYTKYLYNVLFKYISIIDTKWSTL